MERDPAIKGLDRPGNAIERPPLPEHGDATARADHVRIKAHAERPAGLDLIVPRFEKNASQPKAGGPVPVVACDVAVYAELAALRDRRHTAGGHCNCHAVAQPAIVLNDLGLQSADLQLEAGGKALQLTYVDRVCLIDAGRHVGNPPLVAGGTDRHRICSIRNRAIAKRDRIGSRRGRARCLRLRPLFHWRWLQRQKQNSDRHSQR